MYKFQNYYINSQKHYNEIYNFILLNVFKNYQIKNNELYISKEDRDFLLNNKIYIYDNKFYIIDSKIISLLKLKISKQLDILQFFDPFPNIITYNNENIEKFKYYNNYLKVVHIYPAFFIENFTDKINYNNKQNLEYIQQYLLNGYKISDIPGFKTESIFSTDYWKFVGWDEETAKSKVSEYQKNNGLKRSNKLKSNPEKYKDCFTTQLGYYIKQGLSEEDAKIKLKERQHTFSKEKCIKKYGEEKGLKIFNERQKKWQNTLINKDNYVEILISRQNYKGYSGISQELFNEIDKEISLLDIKTYFATKNHEYGIGIKNKGGVLYDFVIPSLKYAIEFNGEKFHPRKDKLTTDEWNNWKNPYTKEYADIIYKRDSEKIKALENKGFKIDIVWYNDYINNKQNIIRELINKIIKIYEDSKNGITKN